jgi:hypothetical protein
MCPILNIEKRATVKSPNDKHQVIHSMKYAQYDPWFQVCLTYALYILSVALPLLLAVPDSQWGTKLSPGQEQELKDLFQKL